MLQARISSDEIARRLGEMTATIDLTEEALRRLPLPSPAQHRAFVEHLAGAHRWYKHLPLLTGGTFVVFLAPDAGRKYPAQHPGLPFGNTVEGYRRAFGHLDYMWSVDGGPFARDSNPTPELLESLIAYCSFALYPYVSEEFNWSEHADAVEALRAGATHPQKERLLAWEAASRAAERAETEGPELSVELRHSHRSNGLAAALRIQEVTRIEKHLHHLYEWHRRVPQE
jgi:hypothetical protein